MRVSVVRHEDVVQYVLSASTNIELFPFSLSRPPSQCLCFFYCHSYFQTTIGNMLQSAALYLFALCRDENGALFAMGIYTSPFYVGIL